MAWQGIVASGVFDLFNRTYGGGMASGVTPAPSHISAAPRGGSEVNGNIRSLADRLDELTLACRAMWALIE